MNHCIATKLRLGGFFTAITLVLISILLLSFRGLSPGIEFTGGMVTHFKTEQAIDIDKLSTVLSKQLAGQFELHANPQHTEWTVQQGPEALAQNDKGWFETFRQQAPVKVELLDYDAFGPQVGKELVEQGGLALLTSLLAILLYLALRFEWRLAVGAIAALFHDVIVVLGIFALSGLKFDLTVLAAILAVIGYSLNDSIIVADRMRELMTINKDSSLNQIVNGAIASTMTRTLITSGTTLATIASVWLLAGAPLQGFSVALFGGIVFGTLSSICIAATVPVLLGLNIDHYKPRQDDPLLELN